MRMIHYFGVLALVATLLLFATLWTGISAAPNHLTVGLLAAMLTVAAHSALILFMVVTGRVLREAMVARPLGDEFLGELNAFFARKAGYPAALFAVLLIATAAVLGYANRSFALPSVVHMLVGIAAVIGNLAAFGVEARSLLDNQRLIDRAADRLDELDRQREAAGLPEPQAPASPGPNFVHIGLTIALGAWLPYLYRLLIVWKGRSDQVSVHPWIECSAVGFALLVLALRERRASERAES
ncbi:MAG: hypothetical protein QF903_09925 [Planctomycetota bacterium]|jgi:hypothetical protein|nr:hypothetical protein [Planctomycetota bacterium]MDP6761993.1 hypothetical protein [Planctomycetota bacterium]MDP6989783.1 hypothetical protein [Planctomycetota bacterium]